MARCKGRDFGPALVFLILAVACASSSAGPAVTIRQVSEVAQATIRPQSGLPVVYEIEITNPFNHPVTLISVEMETVGVSGSYAMNRVKHAFDREIAAHGNDVVQVRAWVQPLLLNENDRTSSPVMMRGTARFNSAAGVMQTAFTGRVQ